MKNKSTYVCVDFRHHTLINFYTSIWIPIGYERWHDGVKPIFLFQLFLDLVNLMFGDLRGLGVDNAFNLFTAEVKIVFQSKVQKLK